MARLNLDQLSQKINYDKSAARQSQEWFSSQVKYLANQVSRQSLMANGRRLHSNLVPGQMALFSYFPKGAETLPYYDVFPLVIPFAQDATSFTGINFHYLPVKMRVVLLKNLLGFATNKTLTEKTKMRLSWQFIGGVSKYRGVNAAVKKYRFDHLESQFLFIPADQWFNAVMLPIEKFNTGKDAVYVDKNLVWRDSIKYL